MDRARGSHRKRKPRTATLLSFDTTQGRRRLMMDLEVAQAMSQEVTLSLPEALYEQIKQAAERLRRPINVVLAEAVAAVAPVMDTAPERMRSALAHLAYLNDAALWQAARGSMAPARRERLEVLHDKQQREGLTAEEQAEEEALLSLCRDTLLVRAQAAVLLKQRGYDVTDLSQFAPLE